MYKLRYLEAHRTKFLRGASMFQIELNSDCNQIRTDFQLSMFGFIMYSNSSFQTPDLIR